MCIDTPVTQPFTCASTVSLTVVGDTEAGLDELFAHLSDGGTA
jgi:predicted 3-demethylubiquinone-9 3-methyltransferase (glyoxalase superfamily)